MEWRLFGDLAERAGDKRVAVDADPGDEIGEALDALLSDRPDLEERVLTDDGSVREHVNVLRNGANVSAEEDGLKTTVDDGDELALFPPVSGG